MDKFKILIKDYLTSFRTILIGYILLILLGALLLSLPIASNNNEKVSFIDALFTATSATCVTGLVIFDTATKWTLFGKIIILILIQIGGIGVVTVAILTLMITGKQIGLMQRSIMQDSISAPQLGGIIRFVKFFLTGTFIMELIGAICLFPIFYRDFGLIKGIGYAIFHSISAFCNAGFDLMGVKGPFSSLTTYSNNMYLNIVIVLLIIIGGIGFVSWQDLLNRKFKYKELKVQTKIILVTTFILLLLGFLYFFFIEFKELKISERIIVSIFQTVTPRTAGFNTYDYNLISETGLLVTVILMLIGGAPGSTAGGIKVTTIFIIFVAVSSYLRRKEDANCFKRRIEPSIIHNAFTVFMMYLTLLCLGTIVISNIEDLPIIKSMFESASALGTVGLTTGITPSLSTVSKAILIFFMFFGRVGGLTVAYAMTSRLKKENSKYPVEKVIVG